MYIVLAFVDSLAIFRSKVPKLSSYKQEFFTKILYHSGMTKSDFVNILIQQIVIFCMRFLMKQSQETLIHCIVLLQVEYWKQQLLKTLLDLVWICIIYNLYGKEMVKMVWWMYYLLRTVWINQGYQRKAITWKYNLKTLLLFSEKRLLHFILLDCLHYSWKIYVYSFFIVNHIVTHISINSKVQQNDIQSINVMIHILCTLYSYK